MSPCYHRSLSMRNYCLFALNKLLLIVIVSFSFQLIRSMVEMWHKIDSYQPMICAFGESCSDAMMRRAEKYRKRASNSNATEFMSYTNDSIHSKHTNPSLFVLIWFRFDTIFISSYLRNKSVCGVEYLPPNRFVLVFDNENVNSRHLFTHVSNFNEKNKTRKSI